MTETLLQTLSEPRVLMVVFVLLSLLGAVVMSRIAGWPALARLYPAAAPPAGRNMGFCTGALGRRTFPIRYRRCLRIVLNEQGLYASLMFPFKIGAPAIFVPWSQVRRYEVRRVMRAPIITLEFKGHENVLALVGPAGEAARDAFEAASVGHGGNPG